MHTKLQLNKVKNRGGRKHVYNRITNFVKLNFHKRNKFINPYINIILIKRL